MLSRRDFLKSSMITAGAIFIKPGKIWQSSNAQWDTNAQLGRNCSGGMITMRAKPSIDSPKVKDLYEDEVVVWNQEVIGEAPLGVLSRRWVETPEGYLYAPNVQPVRNNPNEPLTSLPATSEGTGMWAEVSVPYVDLVLEKAPSSPWLKEYLETGRKPRLYYSQVMWIDGVSQNDQGQLMYHVNEKYGNPGDAFWADARAFRQLTDEEISPINPDAVDKRIVVHLNYQTLSCYEGNNEVFFCRVSTGAKFDAEGNVVEKWATPIGAHQPWRKVISIHMASGSTGSGYDTPGIAWTMLFDKDGAAIHSTFWHNDFGTPRSHGCVNARPEDAKWIFRWSLPQVLTDPGNYDISGPVGTVVDVVENRA
jgi:hypothetical protein